MIHFWTDRADHDIRLVSNSAGTLINLVGNNEKYKVNYCWNAKEYKEVSFVVEQGCSQDRNKMS